MGRFEAIIMRKWHNMSGFCLALIRILAQRIKEREREKKVDFKAYLLLLTLSRIFFFLSSLPPPLCVSVCLSVCLSLRLMRPTSILLGTVSNSGDGKHTRLAVDLLSSLRHDGATSCRKSDLGPTTDRLPVKITCRVTSLCKVILRWPYAAGRKLQIQELTLHRTFKNDNFSGLTMNHFVTFKVNIDKINDSISFRFFLMMPPFI